MRTLTLTVTLFALVSQGGVAFAQQNKQKEATIISGMTVEIDSKGRAVIITPRSGRPLTAAKSAGLTAAPKSISPAASAAT